MSPTLSSSSHGQAGNAPLAVILASVAQVAAAAFPALGIGTPVGQQSDMVQTLITPAGWAFSIWGALYLGSFVFAIYQALPAQRSNALLHELRWPAAGAFLGNALWAAYVQLSDLNAGSVVIIAFSLACILVAFRRLADWREHFAFAERWCAMLPLSALAAWLTAATIVNVAASLRYHGLEATAAAAPIISAGVVIIGGIIAGLALVRSRGNPPFALVFLWALAAIYAAGGQQAGQVGLAAIAAAVLTVGGFVVGLHRGGINHWFARG